MSCFKVVVSCHQLAKQPGTSQFVSHRHSTLSIMKYSSHADIVEELELFFGRIRLVDGGEESFTATTGDLTCNTFNLPSDVPAQSIKDIAHSIVAAHEKQVRQYW